MTDRERQIKEEARDWAAREMLKIKKEMERLQGQYDFFLNKYNQLTIELQEEPK
jgi:hypothetical protein